MGSQEWGPERVRALREARGWTLQQAADAVGVGLRAWQRWEQPEGPSARSPRGAALRLLAQFEREAEGRTAAG